MHELYQVFWGATWGNNVAAVEWVAISLVAGWLGKTYLKRVLEWFRGATIGPVHERLDEVQQAAHAAREIAADAYRHLTGQDHPKAPDRPDGEDHQL